MSTTLLFSSYIHLTTNKILPFPCISQLLNNQIFPWHIIQTLLSSFFNWHATAQLLATTEVSFQGHINTLVDQCGNGKHHLPESLEVYGDNTNWLSQCCCKRIMAMRPALPTEITAFSLLYSANKSF